ncbi:hypothetical protein Acsp04_54010 [Actinomadura sp. NBRC 104425]|nr:hypothetical protein Acsp04_54010 [Actinomadura sp. NBRC 104425]
MPIAGPGWRTETIPMACRLAAMRAHGGAARYAARIPDHLDLCKTWARYRDGMWSPRRDDRAECTGDGGHDRDTPGGREHKPAPARGADPLLPLPQRPAQEP